MQTIFIKNWNVEFELCAVLVEMKFKFVISQNNLLRQIFCWMTNFFDLTMTIRQSDAFGDGDVS